MRIGGIIRYCKKENISYFKYVFNSLTYKIEIKKKEQRDKRRYLKIEKKQRKRLINKNPTILSINCNGCTISHDLGLRFNSQFVNLWMYPKEFLKYMENLDYYNALPISFVEQEEYDYPVGMVGDIHIFFTHYHTNEEANAKWEERKKRIDKSNAFVMMTDQEGCTLEDVKRFGELPFPNKVLFTNKPYADLDYTFYIKGFEKDKSVGKLNGYINNQSLYKWYDQFDYVTWFNTGSIKRDDSYLKGEL